MVAARTSPLRFLTYGALIVVLFTSLFYLYQYYHSATLEVIKSEAPDLVASQLDAWHFDLQGQPQYRLISVTAQHYDKGNRTDFTQVTGYLYMINEPFWEIKADTAVASNSYETVFLNGNVSIHQAASTKNMAQTLTTDHLTVYPQKKTAQTDALLTATRQNMVTTSQGAFLNLNNNSVKLHQAYTIYTPSSAPPILNGNQDAK